MSSGHNAESSKQGKKRAKKQKVALAASMEEDIQREGIRIMEPDERSMGSNNSQTLIVPNATKDEKKKGRGHAQLKNDGKLKVVTFNKWGSPVGPGSQNFVSFLGQLVREQAPASSKSWKQVPQHTKDIMWEKIEQNYIVQEWVRSKTMSRMAKLRRGHKANLTKAIKGFVKKKKKESSDGQTIGDSEGAESLDIISIKPTYMDDEGWMEYVEDRTSKKFKVISKKQRAIRRKQKYVHTSSRRGFQRIEHDLKQEAEGPRKGTRDVVWVKGHTKNGASKDPTVAKIIVKINNFSQTPTGQSSTGIHDDALAHIFGPERPGRVRGMGFGATPSLLNAVAASSETNSAVMDELRDLRQRVSAMDEMQERLRRLEEHMTSMPARRMPSNGSEVSVTDVPKAMPSADSHGQPCGPGSGGGQQLVNRKCILLHWFTEEEEEVAYATIAGASPTCKVHGVPLGKTCYKVWVDKVLVDGVHLFRPTDEFRFLNEAVGSTIAWSTDFIKFSSE